MAPVEFEKELQERMRSREVKPRPDSWDRIESRLQAEPPTPKRSFMNWKFFAAASVVFLLGYFIYQTPESDLPENKEVVVSPKEEKPENSAEIEKKPDFNEPEMDKASAVVREEAVKTEQLPEPTLLPEQTQSKETSPASAIAVVETESPAKLTDQSRELRYKDLEQAFQTETPTVIAATEPDDLLRDPSDEEVDALLSRAMKQSQNKGVATDTVSLNPAALLGEVESELDQSFREQIFEKIKSGYNKVRTSVADRSK